MSYKKYTKAELIAELEARDARIDLLIADYNELGTSGPEGSVIRLIDWCQENEIHLTALDVDGIKLGFAAPPGQPLVPQHSVEPATGSEEDDDKPKAPMNHLSAFAQHDPPPRRYSGELDED